MDRIKHFRAMLAGHKLKAIADGPVPCWRLSRPETNRLAVVITATPEGVVIQCSEQDKGKASSVPLSEFVGELDSGYLANRFLTKRWSRTAAEAHLEGLIQKLEQLGIVEQCDDASSTADDLRRWRNVDSSLFDSKTDWQRVLGRELGDMLNGVGRFDDPMIEASEAYPPKEFNADEVARLVAIHERFSELFRAAYRLDGETYTSRT